MPFICSWGAMFARQALLLLFLLPAILADVALHNIRQQAQLYEDIYQESQALDDAALQESASEFDSAIATSKGGDTKFIWDYFPERFTCVEGVERTAMDTFRWDGGKWICGLRNLLQRQGCVVYSFGSRGDASFEKAILERTACEVFTFDPTLNAQEEALVKHVQGIKLFPWGLTSSNRSASQIQIDKTLGTMKTLTEIMSELNHTWVDVLKIDIEGYENMVLQEFATNTPAVTQLLVELHLMTTGQIISAPADIKKTLVTLRQAGFKVYRREPNYNAPSPYGCWEYAMIRTDEHGFALLPDNKHKNLVLNTDRRTAKSVRSAAQAHSTDRHYLKRAM